MVLMNSWTRRDVLRIAAAAGFGAAVAGCASEPESPTGRGAGDEPSPTFNEPAAALSGSLTILLWSHFVASHDEWFDTFATDWGKEVGVDVRVDHVDVANVPTQIASELQAGQGHDLMQYIATLSQFEPSVLDLRDINEEAESRYGEQLKICRDSSYNPHTDKFYAFSPGWVPDPGNYRRSLWEPVGLPDGPSTWEELLTGGAEIMSSQDTQLGLGMSQEIDSNMAGHALMWSYGASIQDESERVVLDSPETIAAVEFMTELFSGAMTDEVFSWNAASNNEGLIAGKLSYILNSISAYRSLQEVNPEVANDTFFVPALSGPEAQLAATHVMYNWIVPNYSPNPDAAREFLLHYTANLASATYESQLYDYPAFPNQVPDLDGWVESDPFGSQPPDKLSILKLDSALEWSTNMGHPGPANPAEGEVFGTFVIPNMMARVARGEQSAADSVAQAESEIVPIFDKWRQEGLIGGGSA